MNIVSLFSGCGGLDLGFHQAGFNIIFANECDRSIWKTYELNHPQTKLNKKDLRNVSSDDVPECIGIIGGPPCQSWSEAGAGRGIKDNRGQLFYDYIRIVRDKQPLFFLAENVRGILSTRHIQAFTNILNQFREIGYNVSYQLLNANDFNVPQDRKRVIIVGYHESMKSHFQFPKAVKRKLTLKNAIYDLSSIEPNNVKDKLDNNYHQISNHEYLDTGYSSVYMSRNRVRMWNEPSFTIQAGGRHAPIHPQANRMIFVEKDKRIFDPNSPKPYRRLSVRECARIQTFPDSFILKYTYINHGYKMIGNAVPVNLAKILAQKIKIDVLSHIQGNNKQSADKFDTPKQITLIFPS